MLGHEDQLYRDTVDLPGMLSLSLLCHFTIQHHPYLTAANPRRRKRKAELDSPRIGCWTNRHLYSVLVLEWVLGIALFPAEQGQQQVGLALRQHTLGNYFTDWRDSLQWCVPLWQASSSSPGTTQSVRWEGASKDAYKFSQRINFRFVSVKIRPRFFRYLQLQQQRFRKQSNPF